METIKRTFKLTPVVTGIRIDAGVLSVDAVLQDALGNTVRAGTGQLPVSTEGSEAPAEMVDAVEAIIEWARAYARSLAD
jgi:hypothetical protein